jgi:D-amino-acid dehydrogenase
MLCRTPHALDEESETAEMGRALGIESQTLSAQEVAALDPGIRMEVEGGVYFPQDRHLTPQRFVSEMQDRLAGWLSNCLDTEVVDWRVDTAASIRAISTKSGLEIEGDEFVLCGGSWSPSLVRRLGLEIPIEAGKGYSLTLRTRGGRPRSARSSPKRASRHADGRHAALRGDMEIAGLDETISPVRVRSIIAAATTFYPEIRRRTSKAVEPWRGCGRARRTAFPTSGARGDTRTCPSRRAMR